MSRLTDARRSLWAAIDNWPALATTFKTKLRYDSVLATSGPVEPSHRPDMPSSPAELPAIAIYPSRVTPTWATNLQKDHPYALDVVYWTAGKTVDHSEAIWDEIIKAIYRSKPPGNADQDTYIKEGTGYRVIVGEGPSQINLVKIGTAQQKFDSTQHRFTVVLRMKVNALQGNF